MTESRNMYSISLIVHAIYNDQLLRNIYVQHQLAHFSIILLNQIHDIISKLYNLFFIYHYFFFKD